MTENQRVQDLMNGRRKSVKVQNGKLVTVEEDGAVRQSLGTLRRISWNESSDMLLCMLCVWYQESPQFIKDLRSQIEFFTMQLNDPNAVKDLPFNPSERGKKWTDNEVRQVFDICLSPGPQRYKWIKNQHPWFAQLEPMQQEKCGSEIVDLLKNNASEEEYLKVKNKYIPPPSSPTKLLEAKVVMIGDSGVGKTCALLRYVENKYTGTSQSTIGAALLTKQVVHEDTTVKLQLWDTAGEERHRSMLPMYYRNAIAVVLVYDITNDKSFESVKFWVKEIAKHVMEGSYVTAIVGNKLDIEPVPLKQAKEYAEGIGAIFCEISVKNNQGIEELFSKLVTAIVKKKPKQLENKRNTISVTEKPKEEPKTSGGCAC